MTRLGLAVVLVALMTRGVCAQTALVVRADASLASLGPAIAIGLERRTGREAHVGEALEDATPRDLGPGSIGISSEGERIRLFASAPSGALHITEIGVPTDARATSRVVVVALASFLEHLEADVATSPRAEPAPVVRETYELPIDGSTLDDLASPVRAVPSDPRLAMELRERAAYDTQRDAGHVESGLSIGACFGAWWCLQLDADAMAPEEDHGVGTGTLSYQATTIGVGARFSPLEAGPVRGGIGVDALARIGHVWTDTPSAEDTTLSAAMRLMADLAIHVGGPVLLAIEAGADIAFNATRYLRATRFVFAEDVVTLWGALALRFVVGDAS